MADLMTSEFSELHSTQSQGFFIGFFEAEVSLIFHKIFGCQGRFAAGSSTIGALEKAICI